ncbi:MAG TPA: 2-amino-4-hydroxy-6-hydroxymethyldihydropteridine diphosphokinase [Bacteroidia bacterium]|nr:2-amino-4-hydroxy-6-hydroxymethyldihydropteridine diphosphokinase [Bacteroidia bacterium]
MNAEKSKAVLLLGSNSGDRVHYINKALSRMEKLIGNTVLKSSLYESSPWGFAEQPDFLNQVAVIKTPLKPVELLKKLKEIEKEIGRTTSEKWKQRIIDIDILFYDEIIFESEELTIPHPMLHERKFTLVPLIEIMPGFIHPVLKKTISELIISCDDTGEVRKITDDFIKA